MYIDVISDLIVIEFRTKNKPISNQLSLPDCRRSFGRCVRYYRYHDFPYSYAVSIFIITKQT